MSQAGNASNVRDHALAGQILFRQQEMSSAEAASGYQPKFFGQVLPPLQDQQQAALQDQAPLRDSPFLHVMPQPGLLESLVISNSST